MATNLLRTDDADCPVLAAHDELLAAASMGAE
jgi:hypothetical protein